MFFVLIYSYMVFFYKNNHIFKGLKGYFSLPNFKRLYSVKFLRLFGPVSLSPNFCNILIL